MPAHEPARSTLRELNAREWRKETHHGSFVVSTSPSLLNLEYINAAFKTQDMSWAKPLPWSDLQLMLEHSITLGLYQELPAVAEAATASEPSSPRTPSPTLESRPDAVDTHLRQIGLARFITDHVTFVYLTDVFVSPEYRRSGHARWLMQCCRETIDTIPALRRVTLVTSLGYGRAFYKETLGLADVKEDEGPLITMTRSARRQAH